MIPLLNLYRARFSAIVRRVVFAVLIISMLSSCRAVSVADDINQTQANQIVALLNSRGISSFARHDSAGKDKYSIEVDRTYYAQAKTLLAERNLPGLIQPSISEMIEPRGLLPNPREMDAMRIDNALSVQLEEMLKAHPAIASAKVVVRYSGSLPDADRGASIVVQSKTEAKLDQSDVLKLVGHVLPGVPADKILVIIEPETKPFLLGEPDGVYNENGKVVHVPLVPFLFNWRVPDDDYNAMVYILIGCFFLLAIIGGLIGYWFGYYQHSRQLMDAGLPDLSARSLRLDRPTRDMPEV